MKHYYGSTKLSQFSTNALFIISLAYSILCGCIQVRPSSVPYLKNEIQDHPIGQYSTIRSLVLIQTIATSEEDQFELLAYKKPGEKGLLLSGSKHSPYKISDTRYLLPVLHHAVITEAQARVLYDSIDELMVRMKAETPQRSETVWHDFTVNDRVYVSVKTGYRDYDYAFWVNGDRFLVSGVDIKEKLKKFLDY
jgi:hypothetical protein